MTGRTIHGIQVPAALLALLALGSAACAAPDGRSAEAGRGEAADAAATAAAAAGDAVPKPTAPISIEHAWRAPPAVGSDLALVVEIASARRLEDVSITLDGGEGLVVDAASRRFGLAELEADAVHTLEPAVFAAVPGTHYLAVSVTATIGGARQTRSVTIPVRLGGDSGAPTRNADGVEEGVRSLPAEERSGRR